MSVAEIIIKKLTDSLTPEKIELKDESDKHIGHAGHDGQGESHFRLLIVSGHFDGLSRIARHRMINHVLKDELRNRVHALAIKAYSPEEYN